MSPLSVTNSARSTLADRAAAAGVLTSYVDVDGNEVTTTPEALAGVLAALDAESFEPLPIEPVVVCWDGKLDQIGRRAPTSSAPTQASYRIETEGGDLIEGRATGRANFWALREDLPLGYHRLTLEGSEALLICAPQHATPTTKNGWGVFAPVYALRTTDDDRGIGDLGDLEALIRWTAEQGGDLVAILPLLSVFFDPDTAPSPYSPASVLFWNEMFLDPSAFPFDGSLEFRGGRNRHVDYDSIHTQTRALVDRLLTDTRIDTWAAHQENAHDYARFRAYGEVHGRDWRNWPASQRGGQLDDADVEPARMRWHLAAQWAMDLQLRAVAQRARGHNVMLGLDFPVGVHLDGYDIWANQEVFVDGVTVGAPPDTFFAGGQDWQLVPLHPERSRRTHHRYFIAAMRHQIALGGLLRIDHIMGLFRRWWIPAGGGATEGAYVSYPDEELLAIICLESARSGSVIVGENLGTVPPGVNESLAAHGILGMFIAQDHLDEQGRVTTTPPAEMMALVNTHDMDTFRQRWDDRPDPAAGLQAVVEDLAASSAELVVVSLEDLWLETERQNVPGTTTGNWRQRIAVPIEAINHESVLDFLPNRNPR